MPELPEVETIRRVIGPQIQGHTIREVLIRRPEIVAFPEAGEFCRHVSGETIRAAERRGKFLILLLENQSRILLHLRMTGCLLLTPQDWPQETHTHLIFELENRTQLRFSDPRRFGRFWLQKKGEPDPGSGISSLGPEPFSPELTAAYLRDRLGKRKKAIKDCLMEQGVVAGIGNIYSDEILFTAGIFPARPAESLRPEEWERLAAVIPERLAWFLETNRISPKDYLQTRGRDYRNTPFLQVYGHAGDPCPVCRTQLRRMVIGGRSSVYCPACQKAEPENKRPRRRVRATLP